MQGLEEIRVKFQLTIDGWMGWNEKEVLEPLFKVTRPLKVFEVEMPQSVGEIRFASGDEEREVPFKLIRY